MHPNEPVISELLIERETVTVSLNEAINSGNDDEAFEYSRKLEAVVLQIERNRNENIREVWYI